MDEVHVRSLLSTDAISYIEMLHGIDRESTFLLWEPGERTIDAETLSAAIEERDHTQRLQLVAEADEGLVGFLVCHRGAVRRLRHRCDFTMAVRRNQQRRGVGTLLIRSMQDWARDQGIERIELTVMANNHGAMSLYERNGFMIEGVKRGAIVVDGTAIDEVIMGMRLLTAG